MQPFFVPLQKGKSYSVSLNKGGNKEIKINLNKQKSTYGLGKYNRNVRLIRVVLTSNFSWQNEDRSIDIIQSAKQK